MCAACRVAPPSRARKTCAGGRVVPALFVIGSHVLVALRAAGISRIGVVCVCCGLRPLRPLPRGSGLRSRGFSCGCVFLALLGLSVLLFLVFVVLPATQQALADLADGVADVLAHLADALADVLAHLADALAHAGPDTFDAVGEGVDPVARGRDRRPLCGVGEFTPDTFREFADLGGLPEPFDSFPNQLA
ncbi:hypothetical protein GS534_16985 [Rhodococcus hoagii]|nr:hypothetical protein [Prescottella equi]